MSTEDHREPFNCGRLKDLLPDYLDRDLQEQICEEVKAHLEQCEDCRVYVESIETTIILYKHFPGRDVPEAVRIDLRKHIRAYSERKGRDSKG